MCALTLAGAGANEERKADAVAGARGVRLAGFTISPFTDVSGTYVTDVQLVSTNQQSDYYLDLMVGCNVERSSERFRMAGSLWFKPRWYETFTTKDQTDVGESLGLTLGNRDESVGIGLNESFTRVADYDPSPTEPDLDPRDLNLELAQDHSLRAERSIFDAGVAVGRQMTEKMSLDVGYSLQSTAYDSPGLFNTIHQQGDLGLQHRLTDKTDLRLIGEYGNDNSQDFAHQGNYYAVMIGAASRSTFKTAFNGAIGYQYYQNAGTNHTSRSAPALKLGTIWRATEKLQFQLLGSGGIEPSAQFDNNTRLVYTASLGGQYALSERWVLSLAGSYRMDDYTDPVFSSQEQAWVAARDDQYSGDVRLRFLINRHLELFGDMVYEDTQSKALPAYSQLRATVGLNATY